MRKVAHMAMLAAAVLLILALSYRLFIGPLPLHYLIESLDAVSSASVVVDAPSGDYVVLLNGEKHRQANTVEAWTEFFRGESLVIMDDVKCAVAEQDPGGVYMGMSYQSRLPENQMVLSYEDGTLMLSRAEHGLFDVIVMSREFAQAFQAETVYDREGVVALEIRRAEE